ncbi:SpoIID/LytB domain-containing protein [Moorena sp. SIO3A5]|uniref:SpoIID/LytB domain protein n=2 Tax=Coleofasciculaceae TaxID=1892251 RepID=F4Y2M0_9CYAN|nr:SpoIID/LytB domain-containing protein [Moorena sp. SIO3A5]EGJ28864.1 SpoIID/LytB domain protein [Moorena producens 3L]NEP65610.1 SpoIID/LytB domain-containing protein [Moorena sp. SIO3A5]NER86053.1 SpoIID/LytB domain-containing protein [Moorena sp. SIO3A2]NES84272.1 SpoIID/LytB domain-containing protein [Moorena sp. SIO2B7]
MASKGFPIFIVSMLKSIIVLGGRHWWLSFLVWMVLIAPVQAALELRVAVEQGVKQVTLGSSTTAIVRDGTGQAVGNLNAMAGMTAETNGSGIKLGQWQGKSLWIEPKDNGYVWIGDRWYRGRTRLVSSDNKLTAVNHVDLEHYLYSVIGAEMSPSWPIEALKAQAVAARSYVLHQRSKSKSDIYDVGDTQRWQVYKGLNSETVTTHQAVNATAGQIMTYGNKVILAVFHAASGGHTENVEDIWWSEPIPYLQGVPDYDQGTPVYQWTKTFSASQLSQKIPGVGNIIAMTPVERTPRGRVITLKVEGSRNTKTIKGKELRKILGLKSRLFTVSKTENGFQFNGRGYGHGLGLSQWGAYNLSRRGLNYLQILSHYYSSAQLSQMD